MTHFLKVIGRIKSDYILFFSLLFPLCSQILIVEKEVELARTVTVLTMLFYVVKSIAEYYYLNHHGCPNLYIGFSFSWASRRKFCCLSKIETHFSHLHFLKGKWCPTNYNVSPLKAGTLFYFLLFPWHLYLVHWSSINLCWMVNKQTKMLQQLYF